MIAIITSSMRFYYGITRELKKRGLDFLSLKVGEEIPSTVEVVLTTPGEKPLLDFPRIIAEPDLNLAAEEAARVTKGFKDKHGRLTIGIDPGRRPGIAVLADNRAADSLIAASPREVKGIMDMVIRVHRPREVVVRMGSGGGVYRRRVLRHLREIKGLTIEIVDEHSTTANTPHESFQSHKDASAAVNIALKKGRPLKSTAQRSIKPGEIKDIQKESRAASGDLTITKALARKVAEGKLSLKEAIKKQREGLLVKK